MSNAHLKDIHLAQNNKCAKHIAINCHFVSLLLCAVEVIFLFTVRSVGETGIEENKISETLCGALNIFHSFLSILRTFIAG